MHHGSTNRPLMQRSASSKGTRRSKISGGAKDAALTLTRLAVHAEKLVYVIVSNKPKKYGKRRSRIVYIGTTRKGVDRVLGSVAAKARQALADHGTRRIDVYVYTARRRKHVAMWKKLEQGLLLSFKDVYGCVPRYNTHGKNKDWTDEGYYLSTAGLKSVITRYES